MHREKDLREHAERHNQEHVFDFWDELSDEEKKSLLDDISKVDFALVNRLFDHCVRNKNVVDFSNISPPDSFSRYPATSLHEQAKKIGETSIKGGEFGLFLPAGGQGSRLGYEGPKGCFPATPITGKSLFQVFSEKIIAAQKRYNVVLDWYIMTSEENNATTIDFFEKHKYFGLNKDNIFFFIQGALPSTDTEGKILMRAKHSISFNPDGTGGIYRAFEKSGMIDKMNSRGIKYVFFFNVDNPLAEFVDPLFLGYHIMENCNMSFKVVSKKHAHEKVGVLVKLDGKTRIIEYVNMSKDDAEKNSQSGDLLFKAGNINSMLISVDFIEKISKNHTLSHVAAFKKIPHINKKGEQVHPDQPNAYKFESFVFDALEYADKSIGFEVLREEEFAPIKNADGEDSPASAYALQTNLFKEWLKYAGIPTYIIEHLKKVEISPLFASDKDEFKDKLKDKLEHYENILKEKEEYYFE
jgi:UDP-N-acetylglucosamine/UDP-N-acetylgalactosamine diphosphorylase